MVCLCIPAHENVTVMDALAMDLLDAYRIPYTVRPLYDCLSFELPSTARRY